MTQWAAEADASEPTSAACYNRPEDVRVFAVIVAEGELLNITSLDKKLPLRSTPSVCNSIQWSILFLGESLPQANWGREA